MSIYCIGDIHACYDEFRELLKLMEFNPANDELLLTGDIIGRGPKPLETVRYLMKLGDKAHFVLGNHDLNFLAVAKGFNKAKKRDMLDSLLKASDLKEIVSWFSKAPLMYIRKDVPLCLVHAGISPQWDLKKAISLAQEVEEIFKDTLTFDTFLRHMYSDEPNIWSEDLSGIPRWRFITNVFTRIRFCHTDLSLDFENKSTPENASNSGLYPWFDLRKTPLDKGNRYTIVFGHWAALSGKCIYSHAKALDTGCVWGKRLTGWCFDTDTMYSVKSNSGISMN